MSPDSSTAGIYSSQLASIDSCRLQEGHRDSGAGQTGREMDALGREKRGYVDRSCSKEGLGDTRGQCDSLDETSDAEVN
jgi:hypothetical protein